MVEQRPSFNPFRVCDALERHLYGGCVELFYTFLYSSFYFHLQTPTEEAYFPKINSLEEGPLR